MKALDASVAGQIKDLKSEMEKIITLEKSIEYAHSYVAELNELDAKSNCKK